MRALLAVVLLSGCGVAPLGELWTVGSCGEDWDAYCDTRTGSFYECQGHNWVRQDDCPDGGCKQLEDASDGGREWVACTASP